MYTILPWEKDASWDYAVKSSEKFKNISDRRSKGRRVWSAYVGHIGETAWLNLINKKLRTRVLEWPAEQHIYGSPYDFKMKDAEHNTFTIDVKTTEKSENIQSYHQCNFILSHNMVNIKIKKNIDFCDYYVQMFWDSDTDDVFFVGALSINEIIKIIKENNYAQRYGYKIIDRELMDMTAAFVKGIDDDIKERISIIDNKLIYKDLVYKTKKK